MAPRNLDIDQPRYDQSTYWGRCQYFFSTTNPLNLFNSNATLEESRTIVLAARTKKWEEIKHLSDDDIWRAKELYDSAFHPDTGELMNPIGRMSAQVPMNMAITGCMMNFYKSTPAVIFWQWVNQSFNALVNYTNRSGDAALSNEQIATSYVLATSGALVTALSLNRMTKFSLKMVLLPKQLPLVIPSRFVEDCRDPNTTISMFRFHEVKGKTIQWKLNPLVGRCVPFAAVAAANCINIPLMRMQELQTGIPVSDEKGNKVGDSKSAAKAAIATTTFSRIGMASPGMIITPIVMNRLDQSGLFLRKPWLSTPLSVLICGVCLTFATPMCCALFEQRASMSPSSLEEDLRLKAEKQGLDVVYYNKGL